MLERVFFESDGVELVGHLFLPPGRAPAQGRPAAVVTGSWTTVKEQMAGLYARRLAERGLVALSFDFRGFGESGGSPRELESPRMKAADMRAAIGFLGARPEVDARRLGLVAICASAGYAALAAAEDARIRSLALVAPWLHDGELVRQAYGEEGVRDRIDRGAAARRRFEQTGEVEYVPVASEADPSAAMFGRYDYYLDDTRGRIPQWADRFAVMAWPEWLQFDAIAQAPRLRVPTLLVHSEQAALPQGVRRFRDRLAAPNEMIWLDGRTQLDFYDREPTVSEALELTAMHLGRTLGFRVGLPAEPERTDGGREMSLVADRSRIVDLIDRIARSADLRDWEACRSAFAGEVDLEYGRPEHLRAEVVIDRWRSLLGAFDATQHLVADHAVTVEGDEARATSEFVATHVLKGAPGGDVWTLGGVYEHRLRRTAEGGWEVTRMRMIPRYSLGNDRLADAALDRAAHRGPERGAGAAVNPGEP